MCSRKGRGEGKCELDNEGSDTYDFIDVEAEKDDDGEERIPAPGAGK